MRTKEVCTIKVTLEDKNDSYYEETWVKNIWPMLLPWFTQRHGMTKGQINLNGGSVIVDWDYNTTDADEEQEHYDIG